MYQPSTLREEDIYKQIYNGIRSSIIVPVHFMCLGFVRKSHEELTGRSRCRVDTHCLLTKAILLLIVKSSVS